MKPSATGVHGAPHLRFWPRGVPQTLRVPEVCFGHFVDVAAARYPAKPAIVYGGAVLTYAELQARSMALAGYLQQRLGVRHGDRVLLLSQNCPQFVIAFLAILQCGAAAVPVNPMSTAPELKYFATDSGARVAVVAQELLSTALTLLSPAGGASPAVGELDSLLVHAYSDALAGVDAATLDAEALPELVRAPRVSPLSHPACHGFEAAVSCALQPQAVDASPDDLCVLPYTSGTTGQPKGCRHSHRTLLASNIASQQWRGLHADAVFLSVAPLFHMLGLQNGMNMPLTLGATMVMMPRWNPQVALRLIEKHRVTVWTAPPAMVIDAFAQADAATRDLSSLALLSGGGAAMPEAVAAMLADRHGLHYNEAYGLSETAAFLHANPLARGKRQCLGVPTQGVESRIVDPVTLAELPQGEVGELVTSGQQLMQGYWRRPEADAEAFYTRDGIRFFRTGDLAHVDADGYYFLRDRLKRMVTVSGYKVWPAEVESALYEHPAVHEACVIAGDDGPRGERVVALVVLKAGQHARAEDIIAWSRERMAVYKAPREVQLVASLPKSATGKILWRSLQQAHNNAGQSPAPDPTTLETSP